MAMKRHLNDVDRPLPFDRAASSHPRLLETKSAVEGEGGKVRRQHLQPHGRQSQLLEGFCQKAVHGRFAVSTPAHRRVSQEQVQIRRAVLNAKQSGASEESAIRHFDDSEAEVAGIERQPASHEGDGLVRRPQGDVIDQVPRQFWGLVPTMQGGQVCFDQRTDGRWGVDTLPFVFVAGHEDKHYGADTLLAIVSAA